MTWYRNAWHLLSVPVSVSCVAVIQRGDGPRWVGGDQGVRFNYELRRVTVKKAAWQGRRAIV